MEKPVKAIRILLADDNIAILDMVTEILGDEFLIVGRYTEGNSALLQVPALNPDVIILDISMPNMTGLEVSKRLVQIKCPAKIVILTVHENPEFVRAALDLGVAGYVFKSRLDSDLLPAISSVTQGRTFVSPGFVAVDAMRVDS